jgi:hypothetical protein
MSLARARFCGCWFCFLLAGGNWNNGTNAGPGYRNANNTPSNSNRNISTHLELRSRLSGPEQRAGQNPVFGRVKHTTDPQRGVSTSGRVERSPLLVGLRGSA